MSEIVSGTVKPADVFVSGKQEVDEQISISVAGTAASVTDTTNYALSDQSGLAMTINVIASERTALNLGVQTVTFPASTTTALLVAAAINNQAKQVHATVAGGQVVVTSDLVGSDVTIAAAAGTSGLTFDTPVAGTGSYAGFTVVPGMLLARTTSGSPPYTAGDVVPYDAGNTPTGANTIRGIADFTKTFASNGSALCKMAIAGKAVKGSIVKASGAAVTQAELDALVTNTSITYASVVDGIDYQN